MSFADIVGFIAAVLTTISFLPQALRVWRTRETRGISLGMYSVFSTGAALWVLYGLLAPAYPVLIANLVTLVFAVSILVMKVRYDRPAFKVDTGQPTMCPMRTEDDTVAVTPKA